MADDHATGDTAPVPTTPEALMADRQLFWARFCQVAFWTVVVIAAILILLDLLLL